MAIFFYPIILIIGLFFVNLLTGCTPHDSYYRIILGSDLKNEGFLSKNLFQVKVTGKYPQGNYSIYERRAHAIRNAYDNAIERAIDLIIKYRLKQAQDDHPDYIQRINLQFISDIRKSIKKHTINGEIIQKKFSSDGSCSIVYRIQRTNLLKILEQIPLAIISKGLKNKK